MMIPFYIILQHLGSQSNLHKAPAISSHIDDSHTINKLRDVIIAQMLKDEL